MPRILLIDATATDRQVLRGMLEKVGYEVVEAENGTGGLRLMQGKAVDLVLIDLLLPGQEGLATLATCRQAYPDVKRIALSHSSRLSPFALLVAAREVGAHWLLPKPFSPQDLLGAVRALLPVGV